MTLACFRAVVQQLALSTGIVDGMRRYWDGRRPSPSAFIFYAHGVTDTVGDGLRADGLDHMLGYLCRMFELLPLAEVVDRLASGACGRTPMVALTFDDGYANNLHRLLPVLRAHGAPATIFVTSGLVGTTKRLWTDEVRRYVRETRVPSLRASFLRGSVQLAPGADRSAIGDQLVETMKRAPVRPVELLAELREAAAVPNSPCDGDQRILSSEELASLAADPLITIGAHTVSHCVLSSVPFEVAQQEIDQSRRELAALTGLEPALFAYPNGAFTPEVVEHLRKTGWRAGVATAPGIALPYGDLFRLPRLPLGCGPGPRLAWSMLRSSRDAARMGP